MKINFAMQHQARILQPHITPEGGEFGMLKIAAADLKKSDITVKKAEYAKMSSTSDASTICGEFKTCEALVMPYTDPWTGKPMTFERDGEVFPFVRVRYYGEAPKHKGFGKAKKQLRYSQPKNSGVHPYFPVVDDIDWVAVAKDPNTPIMITEGEKKSLCASIACIPTIGLGGVYNFSHDGELLPVLDRFEWSGRIVYICYDSDAADNGKIQVAEGRLATELSMKRNASVFLVRLPEKKGGAKVGVDDFLAAEGDDALFDLLDAAPEMRKIDKEILKINAEAAYIEKEGLILEFSTDTWIKKGDFIKGSHFSSRKLIVEKASGKGNKMLSIADAWLTHEHSRRYADTIFRPGTTDKAIPIATGGIAYNRFRGLNEIECDEEELYPFFDLYDHMMSLTDEFDHDLILKLLAYKVQNWEENVSLGLILLGSQGGGKSLFCDIIAAMAAPYNKSLATTELGSDFNGWIETSLIVIMNETKGTQLKYCMEKLRSYVSDEVQSMNEKYRAARQVSSYAFYIFNANDRAAGVFPDDDRRMIVVDFPDTHPDGDAFYGPIHEFKKNGGPKKLLHWLMNYDLKGWKPPRKAPETREKRMAYHASLSPVQKLGDTIIHNDKNLVSTWIAAATEWASSPAVTQGAQAAVALEISGTMMKMSVRPWYTPDELALMFPAIAGTLDMGKVGVSAPSNILAQQLLQLGVRYLKCKDNYDGFMYKGQIRQFLVIADRAEHLEPITQAEFDKLMKKFPTYKEWKAAKHKAIKRAAKRANK